jgi:hypothetical protein
VTIMATRLSRIERELGELLELSGDREDKPSEPPTAGLASDPQESVPR